MEDFGDILYILVMLGAVVFSAIKKSKAKQRPMTDAKPSPYDPMDEQDSVIEELKELFNKPKPKPEPVISKAFEPEMKKKPVVVEKKPVRKPQKPIKVLDVDEGEGFNFNADEVDLREAVIYSEILNRPYQ